MRSQYQIGDKPQSKDVFCFVASSFFWKNGRPNFLQYLFEIFSNLQIIAITHLGLYLSTAPAPDISLPAILHKVFKVFSLIDVSSLQTDQTLVNTIFVLICIYLSLFCALLGYVTSNYFTKDKITHKFHYVITYWAQIHHTIFFWVLNVFLMSTLATDASKNLTVFNIKRPSTGLAICSGLLITINYLFAGLGALYCYDPFITTNLFATNNSWFQRLTLLHKGVLSPIVVFISDVAFLKWLFVGFSFVLTFIRYEFLLSKMSFYNFSALKLTSSMACSALGIAVTNMITAIMSESYYIIQLDAIFIEGVAVLLLLKLNSSRLFSIAKAGISLKNQVQMTQEQIWRKIFSLSYFASKANFSLRAISKEVCNESLLHLIGDFCSHSNKCHDKTCICQYILTDKTHYDSQRNEMFETNKASNLSKVNLQFKVLSNAIKASREHNASKILSAYILSKEHRNFSVALLTLFGINEKEKRLHEKILIFHMLRILEEEMAKFFRDSGETALIFEIKQAVDYEDQSEQLHNLIKTNTSSYTALWDYFQQPNMNLKTFLHKSVGMEQEAEQIQQLWHKISHAYYHLPTYTYTLFCTYLTTVRNLNHRADKIFTHYNSKEQKRMESGYLTRHRNIIGSSSDIICYISVARDRIGRVIHVSKNIYDELGWPQIQVVGQNIKTIQAPFIREKHDQILFRHIDELKPLTESSFGGFIQTKEGYIVPIEGQVTIFPYVGKEAIYASVIRKKDMNNDFMVIRYNGFIDSFSEKIGKELGLPTDEKVHINQICPRFEAIRAKMAQVINKGHQTQQHESITLLSQNAWKEVTYSAKIEIMTLVDEHFICLNLHLKKILIRGNTSAFEDKIKSNQTEYGEDETTGARRKLTADSTPATRKRSRKLRFTSFSKKSDEAYFSNEGTAAGSPLFPQQPKKFSKEFSKASSVKSRPMSGIFQTSISNLSNLSKNEKLGKRDLSERSRSQGIRDIHSDFEEAIYYVPKQKYMKILKYLMFFFVLLCIGLVGLHFIDSYVELSHLLVKIDLITICQARTFSLISVNIDTRILTLISAGIISEERHLTTLGIRSWSTFMKDNLLAHSESLNVLNNLALEFAYSLGDVFRDRIRSPKFPMVEQDSLLPKQRVSRVQMISEIVNVAHKIDYMDTNNITANEPTVKFLLDNTLNDLLILSELIVEVTRQDYERSLTEMELNITTLHMTTIAAGLFLFGFLFIDVRNSMNRRDRFLEILLKIDEHKLHDHLRLTSQFSNYLQLHTFNFRAYSQIKTLFSQIIKPTKDAGRTKKKSRNGDRKMLNVLIIQGIASSLATIVLFTLIFVLIKLKFNSSKVEFLEKRDKMIQMTHAKTEITLLQSCLLSYISEGKSTTFKNVPVEQEMNRIFDESNSFPETFTNLYKNAEPEQGVLLRDIIEGNICSLIVHLTLPNSLCLEITEAIGARGLLRLLGILLKEQEEMKNMFDRSNQTPQAAAEVYNSKYQLLGEQMTPFLLKASDLMQVIIKDDLMQSIVDYRFELEIIMIIYGLICIGMGYMLVSRAWNRMEEERTSWRKIMRQIPSSIMSSNKLLKAYLISNCDQMLDPIKNSISNLI